MKYSLTILLESKVVFSKSYKTYAEAFLALAERTSIFSDFQMKVRATIETLD